MKTITALGLLLVLQSAAASEVTLDCGRLLDVKAGVWRERVTVVVENKLIKSVRPMGGAPGQINLSAYSCLPGLIDMHVHLTSQTRKQVDVMRDALSRDPADAAFAAVPFAERTLMAGFTTVRDLGANNGLNVSLKNAIAAGSVVGPRMFTAGRIIATTGGHGDPTNSLSHTFMHAIGTPGPAEGVVNNPMEARRAVRERYKEGADLIKITATGGVMSQARNGSNSQFTDDELNAIVATAKDYGFRVAAHAHGADGIKRALRAGVDSIEHGSYMDDEILALFKKTGAWYVPTISAGQYVAEMAKLPDYYSPLVKPKAAAIGPLLMNTFARAHKAGVKVAFGTDASVYPHGDNAKEFAFMVQAGMPALEAIRSATLNAATLLDQSAQLGSVEAGFAADIVAVKGDPLADISVLQKMIFIMKDGVVYKQP
jgi:imidazolonepropionase-like amidohydrolase